MFGTWISTIQEDLRKSFPASQDYQPAAFKRDPMPVSVGHFLEARANEACGDGPGSRRFGLVRPQESGGR